MPGALRSRQKISESYRIEDTHNSPMQSWLVAGVNLLGELPVDEQTTGCAILAMDDQYIAWAYVAVKQFRLLICILVGYTESVRVRTRERGEHTQNIPVTASHTALIMSRVLEY